VPEARELPHRVYASPKPPSHFEQPASQNGGKLDTTRKLLKNGDKLCPAGFLGVELRDSGESELMNCVILVNLVDLAL